ncbi:MAG: LytTR family DNA-binding domain-containing protein [Bacteroidota bacterium]
MTIQTLIVDDEALARERINSLLSNEKEFHVVAECVNGKEALRLIGEKKIDLLFLDIEMPALDGIGLLEKLPEEKLPMVIFTTAYDSFAVKAFELNAIDYLLKPFTKKRFQDALERVKHKFRSEDKDLYLSQMLATIKSVAGKSVSDKLIVKSEGKIRFLSATEILWIESDANYLRIHTAGEAVVIRDTMTNISARLDSSVFLRLHRTVIANTTHIVELKPWFNDEYIAILRNGTQLPVGRTYRKSVNAFFQL